MDSDGYRCVLSSTSCRHPAQPAATWRRRVIAALGASGLMLALACSGSGDIVCRPDPITGSQACQTSSGGDLVGPAVTTAAAAGIYSVTGCTVNGCQLPDRCNERTKRCEPIRCSETKDCPAGYSCDFSTHLCR